MPSKYTQRLFVYVKRNLMVPKRRVEVGGVAHHGFVSSPLKDKIRIGSMASPVRHHCAVRFVVSGPQVGRILEPILIVYDVARGENITFRTRRFDEFVSLTFPCVHSARPNLIICCRPNDLKRWIFREILYVRERTKTT